MKNQILNLLWAFVCLSVSAGPSYSESEYHIPFAAEEQFGQKRPNLTNSTKLACWHSDLMKISELMMNDPESLNTLEIEKSGKKFRQSQKNYASVDMLKGSRMEVFQTEDNCNLIIAFRGTYKDNLSKDLLQDLYFLPNKQHPDFHPGFVDVARSYRINIYNVVREAREKCKNEVKITLTGHSLGGAVAYASANLLDKLDLGKPELIIFGAPRVVTKKSKFVERVKPIHYYLDKDPVVLTPPGIMFRELTDENYQFQSVPLEHRASIIAHELIQNHLPSNYRKKLEDWCNGNEEPIKVKQFTHTLRSSGYDATNRIVRVGIEKSKNTLLPSQSKSGEKLPTLGETISVLSSDLTKSKFQSWSLNYGDGVSISAKFACAVTHLTGTKTEAGLAYYCRKTNGYNSEAVKVCRTGCATKKGLSDQCFNGCRDHFFKFCSKKWSCEAKIR